MFDTIFIKRKGAATMAVRVVKLPGKRKLQAARGMLKAGIDCPLIASRLGLHTRRVRILADWTLAFKI